MGLSALLFLNTSAKASAEGHSPLVSFSGRNVSLQLVFASFEKQTGMSFFYNFSLIKESKPITAEFKNIPLDEALKEVLRNENLDFYFLGKTIFIVKKKVPSATGDPVEGVRLEGVSNLFDVEGRVTNQQGEPLVGATVALKEGKKITLTDEKGIFQLQKIPLGAILEVSYQGYEKKNVVAVNGMPVEIAMDVAQTKLDEVQVIAYGNTTQRLSTSDVTTIKSAVIQMQPVSNPILALEGRVPGMLITQTSGLPGSASRVEVQIRGENSLQRQGDPLYIVDGVPYVSETVNAGVPLLFASSGNPLNYLNPSDIESISVLKDADGTAIYGSRGANGVILITTKKGKAAKTKIDMNVQNGIGEVGHEVKLLNLRQYLDMRYEAFRNDKATPNPSVDYDLTFWDTTRQTNWQKVLLGGKAQYDDAQASVSGGNGATQFLIGGAYHRETTVFPADWIDKKGSAHFSINNSSFEDKLKIFLSGSYVVDNNAIGGTDPSNMALVLPPDAPSFKNADGTLNWARNGQGSSTLLWDENPIAFLGATDHVSTNNLIAKGTISYKLIRGLEIKGDFGYNNLQSNSYAYTPFAAIDPAIWYRSERKSNFSNNQVGSWIIEPQATYMNNIAGGTLTALIGSTIQQRSTQGQVWNAFGFNSDIVMNNILAATRITASSNAYQIYKYNALYGRINYNRADRYLLNLVVRRDGSSRFGPANRFANFYSIGAGWIFSKEKFFERRLRELSYGKFRASYGTTGNDNVGDYSYLDLYSNILNVGVPYQGVAGIVPTAFYTPNLQWEVTRKLEAGLETGWLKDRILFNASGYVNRSSNQLLSYGLPSTTGFPSVERNLPANLQNEGIELELNTVNIKTSKFRWSTWVSFSKNVNTLVSLSKGVTGNLPALVGRSMGSLLLYRFAGVDPITGIYQFVDSHGEHVFQPNPGGDETSYLNPNPNFFGGVGNSLSYKSFTLDFFFHFESRKQAGYLYAVYPGLAVNQPVTVLKRWQKPGDVALIEKFSQNGIVYNSATVATQSNQYYEDASFIRLKNVSLTYSLSPRVIEHLHLQNLSFYIHAQNIITITSFTGLDPESASSTALPPLRVITFGIQTTL